MVLALDMLVRELIPELIEILMSEHLQGPGPLGRVVDHDGIYESEQQLISLGKDLHYFEITRFHSVFFICGIR